ncbi:hypothetical protein [Rhodococcoides kroppenstedtii]|uniref:hypothetical protein n=1 Tax=Rhodococcoides kroppenstedtii TaxID=293050 RepID=UPI0028EB0D92|nr:hypothetical protein [Rhodococcus kroppenstedtii]
MRQRTAGVVGVAAVFLGGCGGSVEGTPVAELWDPCSLSAEVLLGLGLFAEPGTSPNEAGVPDGEWRSCDLGTETQFVTLLSTRLHISELQSAPRAVGAVPLEISTHRAFQYRVVADNQCVTFVERSFGAFAVSTADRLADDAVTDLATVCSTSLEITRALSDRIPS